jgi:hypothetical protein
LGIADMVWSASGVSSIFFLIFSVGELLIMSCHWHRYKEHCHFPGIYTTTKKI